MFLFVLHLTVSPLHELPKPSSTPNILTPLLHTSLQRVCFGNFHVLTNNSPKEINHSCTQREILHTQCDDKMKHVWGKPCVPACPGLCYLLKKHVPNVFGFCYPLWLQLSLSFGIYDSRSNCLDSFNGTLLECEAWGNHWATSFSCSFQASLAHVKAPGVWGIVGNEFSSIWNLRQMAYLNDLGPWCFGSYSIHQLRYLRRNTFWLWSEAINVMLEKSLCNGL